MMKYVLCLLIALVLVYTAAFLHLPRFGLSKTRKMALSALLIYLAPAQAVLIIGGLSMWIGLVISLIFIPIGVGISALATEFLFKNVAPWAQAKSKTNDSSNENMTVKPNNKQPGTL